jgi:hypothetical protein
MGCDDKAEQVGGRRIATAASGCTVDMALQADDVMKVVAVASGEIFGSGRTDVVCWAQSIRRHRYKGVRTDMPGRTSSSKYYCYTK